MDSTRAEHSGVEAGSGWSVRSRSHVGLRRTENQDFLASVPLGGGRRLLIVADGMGGHAGGSRASRLTVEIMSSAVPELLGSGEAGKDALRKSTGRAHEAVLKEAAGTAGLSGMGTTVVAALVDGPDVTLVNVGDSRAYVLRSDKLEQVTDDHSLVAEMVRRGELTSGEAEEHPQRNVLTRAVGSGAEPQADIFTVSCNSGDVLLLCTDGLHGVVPDREIRRILEADWSLDARCDALVDAALDAGGPDNVTVLLARWGEQDDADVSGPATEPGTDSSAEADSARRRAQVYAIILGLAVVALVAWLVAGTSLFRNEPEAVPGSDSTDVIDTGAFELLLDSTVQLTPSDMVNDSVWSDSLATSADDR